MHAEQLRQNSRLDAKRDRGKRGAHFERDTTPYPPAGDLTLPQVR
jgi:hypothetical protein